MNKILICLFSVMTGLTAMVAASDDVLICNKPGTAVCVSNMQGASSSGCGDCDFFSFVAKNNCGYCRKCEEGCRKWCERAGGKIKMIDYTVYNYESYCSEWVKA